MNSTSASRTLHAFTVASRKIALSILGFAAAIVIFIFGIPLLLFLSLTVFDFIFNNMDLHRFSAEFSSLAHPPSSSLLSAYRFVGGTSNSNHCDFLVAQLRTSPLSHTEISNHYETLTIPPPNTTLSTWSGSPPKATPIRIALPGDEVLAEYPFSDWLERDVQLLPAEENFYVVYAFEDGYPPGADPRCH